MHFFGLVQPMIVNGTCPGKSWKKGLLSPGKPWNFVFASPGKKHSMVCTNPDERICVSVCLRAYLPNHTYDLYQTFYAYCLWPWLGPLPAG